MTSPMVRSASSRDDVYGRIVIVVGALIVLSAMVVFASLSPDRLAAPFSETHDGFNGSVWGMHGRSLLEHGLVASRIGGRAVAESHGYANHPFMTNVVTALSQAVLGPDALGTRGGVFVLSLALLPILFVTLVRLRLDPLVAAAATALMAAQPMFRVYGVVVDTPMVSLPLAVFALLVHRLRREGRLPIGALPVAVAVAAVSSWQAMILCGVLVGADVLRAVRLPESRKDAGLVVVAFVGALASVLLWAQWVVGLDAVLAQGASRAGLGNEATFAAARFRQHDYLLDTFPSLLIAAPGIAIALLDERWRLTAIALAAPPALYLVLFPQGAYAHDYWLYWVLAPFAFGVSVFVDSGLQLLRGPWGRVAAVAAGGLVLASSLEVADRPSLAEDRIVKHQHIGDSLAMAEWPEDERVVPVVGSDSIVPATAFYAGRPVVVVTPAELPRVPASDLVVDATARPMDWRVGPRQVIARTLSMRVEES